MPDDPNGELVKCLESMLREGASRGGERWIYNSVSMLQAWLGGSATAVYLDLQPATPGTMGEILREGRTGVDVDGALDALSRRQMDLIKSGLSEDFLVRGLRSQLHEFYAMMAAPDQSYTKALRDRLLEEVDDPAVDSEKRDIAARMLEGETLQPIGPDDAAQRRADLDLLEELVPLFLDDSYIKDWTRRTLIAAGPLI